MVPASVMVTGHPRGKGNDLQMHFSPWGFINRTNQKKKKTLAVFMQQDLKAFSMC